MSRADVASVTDLEDARELGQPKTPPILPLQWRAQALLTPFGDEDPPMANYSQLVMADVTYDYSDGSNPYMRVRLYMTQDLQYFDFLFANRKWYWLISTPDGPITGSYGPFLTSLTVPSPAFITKLDGSYGNTWPIMGFPCDGWVIPTPGQPASDHGSWYSFRTDNNGLFRIFTFDTNNPCSIPILGSFYIANIPTFADGGASEEDARQIERILTGAPGQAEQAAITPMVTQRDIQTALDDPMASAPCTWAQIQALIPGLSPPSSDPLPVWTDQTFIAGWTIGTDFIPYRTLVYYWYSYGKQQSIFIGLGLTPGKGTYNDRGDCCLYTDHNDPNNDYTDLPQYVLQNRQWSPSCCGPRLSGIGVPRPDWIAATNGTIMASVVGNPNFGLDDGETLDLIACPFERAPGELALFWVWFTGQQDGVLFTEANFVDSTDHSLQLIDYDEFDRNATWIQPNNFSDPCAAGKLPVCEAPQGQALRPPLWGIIGPRLGGWNRQRQTGS